MADQKANPDAEVLAIGARFEAAFAAELAAREIGNETGDWSAWDAAYEACTELVRQIEPLPVRTLAGFRLKARCVLWCHDGGDVLGGLENCTATDERLSYFIVRDLLSAT